MMYNKGDMIELNSESIVIVLNDGIRGRDFVEQYGGRVILYFSPFINIVKRAKSIKVGELWGHAPGDCTKEEIWYYILVGDQKGWVEERRIRQAL